MALATLSIDLVAQLATLQAGMDKAGRIAEKQAAQIEAGYKKLTVAAGAVGAALGAALSAGAIVEFVRATVDGVDKLNDLADATGASIENLSALEDIAKRTGTSMETAGSAVIKLNKALGEAKPGSDQAAALEAIGLSAEKLKQLDPAEALRQVAIALSGFANDGNKARLTQELFGKSLAEVAPLLKDLAEKGELNAKVTTEQAQRAEDFNKQLFELKKNSEDAARSILDKLLPALTDLVKGWNAGGIRGVGDAIGEMIGLGKEFHADRNLKILAEDLKLLKLQFETAPAGPGRTDLERRLNEKTKQYEVARNKYIEVFRLDQMTPEFRPSQNYGDTRKSAPSIGGAKTTVVQTSSEAEKYLQTLTKELQKVQELTVYEKTLDEIRTGRFTFDSKVSSARLLALAAEIDATKEAGKVARERSDRRNADEEAANAAAKANEQADRDRLRAIVDQTYSARLRVVLRDIELINKAFSDGADDTEQWADAIRIATAKIPVAMAEPLSEMEAFAQQAARNIQDALGSSLEQVFSGSANNIGKIWTDTLKRMAAQAAAAQLGKWLLGDQFGKGGDIGGAAKDFFNWASNLSSSFGGARANGGPVRAGRPYLVGERGPEIVVPKSNGTVLPNGTGMGSAGSTYQVIVQGDASENTLRLVQGALAQFEARMMMRGA